MTCSYIVNKVVASKPEVLQVIQEFDGLQRRTELSLVDINKSIAAVNASLNNVKKQIAKPPLSDQDLFAEQMKEFYATASEELKKLRELYKEGEETYKRLCARFGENATTVQSTEFFGFIVAFMNCVKASHKHYLDVQAEEKLKKVAQDWQNQTVSQIQNKAHKEQEKATAKPTPPPFVHPGEKSAIETGKKPIPAWSPAPSPPPSNQTDHGEKKMSLWKRLKNWGK